MPIIVFSWTNIRAVWATPDNLKKVEAKVEEQDKNQDTLNALYLEQKSRQDTQEKVTTLQIESLKELIAVTSELKKKR